MICKCTKDITREKLWYHIKNKCVECSAFTDMDKFYYAIQLLTGKCEAHLLDIIRDNYVNDECSVSDLVAVLSIPRHMCIKLIEYSGFIYRGAGQLRTNNRLKKIEQTTFNKYGVTNISKLDECKDKKADSFNKRYGVDNVWKSDWFKSYNKNIMLEKYGVGSLPNRNGNKTKWWSLQSHDTKIAYGKVMHEGFRIWFNNLSVDELIAYNKKKASKAACNYNSSLEIRVRKLLTDNNIAYIPQYWICQKSYDFYIKNTNIVIEVNGDYWHANPIKYMYNDIIPYRGGSCTANHIWNRDLSKKMLAESYGYNVVYVWEYDMKLMTDSELSKYLLNICKKESIK